MWPARVYYDGACAICAATAQRLRTADTHGRLRWIDITGPAFDAAVEGVDPAAAQQAMHVRLGDGPIVAGADAVLVLAEALPSLRALRWLGRLPGFRRLAGPAYAWFARHRYALTGRCEAQANQ